VTTPASPGCPFCAIVSGAAPAQIVREWVDCLAIVPIAPVADGHVLVITKTHIRDATDNLYAAMAMYRGADLAAELGVDCNLITSIGPAATQIVLHLHLHLVPRTAGDRLQLPWTLRRATALEESA
jgi:histidine triad (HIT) family protein